MDNHTLYVIPARGGSKGIPRKNIRLLAGRPLIHYTIDVARQLAPDSHIILSTDSDEIADTARLTGLPVDYKRPASLATDTAGSREVVIDAMNWAESRGIRFDRVVLLQPTSPMRTTEDVKACLALYSQEIDMVVSVIPAKSNPYYNCFETDPETGLLHISKGAGLYVRRQDAPQAWEYSGSVYVINPRSIRTHALGAMPRRVPCPTAAERAIDLDTPLDWEVAEAVMRHLNSSCQ